MKSYLVISADGARARFFHLEPADVPELESGPNLVEDDVFVNPEREMPHGEMFSEQKSGRNRTSDSPMHGYDDHRSQHVSELERRFAQNIAHEAVTRAKKLDARCIVVAADPKLLGMLRPELEKANVPGLEIREVARDVSKLAPQSLHQRLAREHVLPERKPPQAAWPGRA